VIDQYTRLSLNLHSSSDKTAIADGTPVKLCENKLIASPHIAAEAITASHTTISQADILACSIPRKSDQNKARTARYHN